MHGDPRNVISIVLGADTPATRTYYIRSNPSRVVRVESGFRTAAHDEWLAANVHCDEYLWIDMEDKGYYLVFRFRDQAKKFTMRFEFLADSDRIKEGVKAMTAESIGQPPARSRVTRYHVLTEVQGATLPDGSILCAQRIRQEPTESSPDLFRIALRGPDGRLVPTRSGVVAPSPKEFIDLMLEAEKVSVPKMPSSTVTVSLEQEFVVEVYRHMNDGSEEYHDVPVRAFTPEQAVQKVAATLESQLCHSVSLTSRSKR